MRLAFHLGLAVTALVGMLASCADVLGIDEGIPADAGGSGGTSSVGGNGGGNAGGGAPTLPFSVLWAERWGGAGDERAVDMAVDGANAMVVAGNHTDEFDFVGNEVTHAGGSDIFVVKVGRSGDHLWSYAFGDGEDQYARAVTRKTVSEELTYVTGTFEGTLDVMPMPLTNNTGEGDGFVLRIGDSTQQNAAFRFGGPGEQVPAPITSAPTGTQNLLITGFTRGDTYIGGMIPSDGGHTAFVARIFGGDSSDDWAYGFDTGSEHDGLDIVGDGLSNAYVAGKVTGDLNLGFFMHSSQGQDAFVAKLEIADDPIWLRGFGAEGEESATQIALDANGDLIVAGTFSAAFDAGGTTLSPTGGDADIFLMKLDAEAGDVTWAIDIPGTNLQTPKALVVDPSTGVIFLGADLTGTVTLGETDLSGNADFFIAAIAPDGSPITGVAFGDVGMSSATPQVLTALAINTMGELVVAGHFEGGLDLAGRQLTSLGGKDFFLAVLSPNLPQ